MPGAARLPGHQEETMANSDYNAGIIEEFRAHQGRVSGPWAGIPLILIHHVGARSGTERVTPLAYHSQPGGRLVIWASNGGSPAHPNWYHNLKAHPAVTVEVGTRAFTVLAQEVDGTDRPELWTELVAAYPQLADAQAKTTRRFPLFLLTREEEGANHEE
jgi:deazaflavin-dependent oxidoreductase (nitroreductase family)